MNPNEYCIFILTHGRAGNVKTIRTLRKSGCTSKIILLIDNEDEQEQKYRELYDGKDGCSVYVFDRMVAYNLTDTMDLNPSRKSVVYARNMTYAIAEELGYKYFVMLEDDYQDFQHRWVKVEPDGSKILCVRTLKSLDPKYGLMDKCIGVAMDYLRNTQATQIGFAQTGDLIGGADSFIKFYHNRVRKIMNFFCCRIDRPVKWLGRMNDDVNLYIWSGSQGTIFLSFRDFTVKQETTQLAEGGMTAEYKNFGTYTKSFYSIMLCPSFMTIGAMGWHNYRMHHQIEWGNAVPKIISDSYKKSNNKVERMKPFI